MRTVEPIAMTVLDARALSARAWAGGWVVVSERAEVLLLDTALRTIGRHGCRVKPGDVAVDHDGRVLILAGGRTLSAVDVRTGHLLWTVDGHFLACHITGAELWAAEERLGTIELSIRDPVTGEARRTWNVEDPFNDSGVMMFPHPDPRCVVVWIAAGQDGQAAYLAVDDGSAITAAEIAPRDRLPPLFLDSAATYLSAGDDALEHRAWPAGSCLQSLAWPAPEDDEHEDLSGSDVHLLPGGHASWSSEYGRIYILDLGRMHIVDELVIAGHSVLTVEELYPSLAGDKAPCTDFEYAVPGPDGLILTVHARTQLVVSKVADWSAEVRRHP